MVNKIFEEKVELNTATSGFASITTKQINGWLEGFIISTSAPVEINISLEDYPEVVLYNVVNFSGTKYEIVRATGIQGDREREKINFSSERIALSDKLRIEVKGPYHTTIKLVVRYS